MPPVLSSVFWILSSVFWILSIDIPALSLSSCKTMSIGHTTRMSMPMPMGMGMCIGVVRAVDR